jgi:DNA-binding HxlR family transcriptional regulator
LGRSMTPVLKALKAWGDSNIGLFSNRQSVAA